MFGLVGIALMAIWAQGGVDAKLTPGPPQEFKASNYPRSFVERPLGTPEGMAQTSLTFGADRAGETNTALGLNADYGLTQHAAVGVRAAWQTSPESQLDYAVINGQHSLGRVADLRIEVGITRSLGTTGNVAALGLPLKWRLSHRLAFVSGRASYSPSEDNVLRVQLVTVNGTAQRRVSLFIPLGLVAQLGERVGLGFRTGYRVGLAAAHGSQFPTVIDVVLSVAHGWDLGISGEAFGTIDPAMADQTQRSSASLLAWSSARF